MISVMNFYIASRRMSTKKAIASNESAEWKNASEREKKIMTKARRKKKHNAKTIENAMKHHRMNIVPTTNILWKWRKKEKKKQKPENKNEPNVK